MRNAVLARHPRCLGAGAAIDVDSDAAVFAVGAELGFEAGDGLLRCRSSASGNEMSG